MLAVLDVRLGGIRLHDASLLREAVVAHLVQSALRLRRDELVSVRLDEELPAERRALEVIARILGRGVAVARSRAAGRGVRADGVCALLALAVASLAALADGTAGFLSVSGLVRSSHSPRRDTLRGGAVCRLAF